MSDVIQGKIIKKYQAKKRNNLQVYNYMEDHLTERGKELFKLCSTFNQFITTENKKNKKLVYSNACKNRFCPICAWRKSCKDAMKISIMMESIKLEKSKDFIFLTLTTPNIKENNLCDEINKFNKSFKKLFDRVQIKKSIKGYVRKLEITYNKKRDDYNPHFHVLLCVDKGYFKKKELYIKHSEWLRMWKDVTGIKEITQVYVQKVYSTRGNVVSEIAKYSAKDYEMSISQEVFDVFYTALKGRQVIVYGGLLKEFAKRYENGELDKYKSKDKNEYYYRLIAKWDYNLLKFNKEYEELSEIEKEKYNR